MKNLLKILLFLTVIVFAYLFAFTDVFEDTSPDEVSIEMKNQFEDSRVHPVFHRQREADKDGYVAICRAAEQYDTGDIFLGKYSSNSELKNAQDRFSDMMRDMFYENPQYFWVDIYNFTFKTLETGDAYKLYIKLEYTMSRQEAEKKKASLDKKIDDIAGEAEKRDNTFDKVLYVYDYILDNTVYDDALVEKEDFTDDGVTAYGCLVNGRAICSGYTFAFNAILQRLGYECGAEFNSYQDISIFTGHVWNWVKLDGDYYYFDLTWGDSAILNADGVPYIEKNYRFFGMDKALLEKSRFPDDAAPTPECNGTRYNYYVYNGMYLPAYDSERAVSMIQSQSANGFITLRFDSYSEALSAQYDLIDNQGIFKVLPDIESCNYLISDDNVHLFIFY